MNREHTIRTFMKVANRHWKPLTEPCRAALRSAIELNCADATPRLPDTIHPETLRSLQRRGLADGRFLTPLGVHVTKWADR
jgi:hypothetical protein